MHERIGKTSREIYDVWFFLNNRFPINKEIVKQRSGVEFKELVEKCISQLEKLSNSRILDGVGELLDIRRKTWVKTHLREDTISLLKLLL